MDGELEASMGFRSSFFFFKVGSSKICLFAHKTLEGVSESPRGDEFRAQRRGWFSVSRGTVLPSLGEGRGDR